MSERFLGGYSPRWYDSIQKPRELIYRYNNTRANEVLQRYEILKQLLGAVPEDAIIEPPFHCDEGKNIFLGKRFYANYNLTILDYDKVIIGDNVLIGPNVVLSAASHETDPDKRWRGEDMAICGAPVVIGDNVWIGANCTVLPGVTIGSGTVIGAGSVVNRSLPKNVMAAGAPARIIKKLK